MGLFGKTKEKDPKEMVREWRSSLRKEQRVIDRQIRSIQNEENKVKRSLRDAAKKGDNDVCRILAKELVQSRKAVSKLYASKAQMNSVMMSMQTQLSTIRMTGSLQKSTEVMRSMNSLMRVPEIQETMRELSQEMMKAGIMEEMMEDTFESVEEEGLDEAADVEVEKILFEVTNGILGKASETPTQLPEAEEGPAAAAAVGGESSDEEEEMQKRLEALRS
ncbi:charged multivesicular body protein 3-like [Corticium candelabrum]|uniref:charged multivesicular body protein 3-like n=1 Tax=Corticium candelabrum TaxID=121492 RepID=UPI002E2757B5|nr:charged multivesicular body protein 3-like [Corticium candelabrum]